jgi:hypothetical protein
VFGILFAVLERWPVAYVPSVGTARPRQHPRLASLATASAHLLEAAVASLAEIVMPQRVGASRTGAGVPTRRTIACVATLVYELLDAHDATAQLAEHLAEEDAWAVHLEHLRVLQRRGREVMADLTRER